MIHEIGDDLAAQFRATGCPVKIVDGPEPTKSATFGRERIVLEYAGADGFTSVRSQHINPPHRRTRAIAARLTIYAQSTRPGAILREHYARANAILDQVLVGLDRVAADRHNAWRETGGRFITPEDLAASENPGGVVYELTFTWDRGVRVQTFKGEAAPEFTIGAGGMRSTTKVSGRGDADENDPTTVPATAETACGA
jgi:hypothetical protein